MSFTAPLHFYELLARLGTLPHSEPASTGLARLFEDVDDRGVWHPRNLRSAPKPDSPMSYHAWPLAAEGKSPESRAALVDEFLRVWTRNHNPNVQRDMTDPYMFMYGFDQRASGIPLTRSKQERSLAALAEWVPKLRALPIAGGLDEQLLANAFMASHSNAEVYRLETMQRVFGVELASE